MSLHLQSNSKETVLQLESKHEDWSELCGPNVTLNAFNMSARPLNELDFAHLKYIAGFYCISL